MIKSIFQHEKFIFGLGACSFLFILCFALISQQLILLAIPVVFISALLFIKDIRIAFYLLILSLPFSINLSEIGKINLDFPDEPLMLILTLFFIFFALQNKNRIQWKSILKHPLIFIILISFIWTIVSVLQSEDVILSFKYLVKKIWYLMPFLFIPIIFFQDQKMIKKSYQYIFSTMFIVTTIVMIRFSAVGFSFEKVHDPLQPFFQNHVMYGSMLSCLAPVAAFAFFRSRTLSIQWLLSLLGFILFVVAAYLSYSRAAWLGVVFAGFAYIMIRFRMMHYVFLGIYIVVFTTVMWLSNQNKFLDFKPKFEKTIMHESLEDHIMATIQGTDISSAERYYRWIAAARMSSERPITGVGPNNFYNYYKAYTVSSFKTWVSRNTERSTTHNYFLFMLVEQGYPAMILYGLLIFYIFFIGQKIYHRTTNQFDKIAVAASMCMIAALFINNFFSELIETDKIGSLFYLGIAIIVAIDLKNKNICFISSTE